MEGTRSAEPDIAIVNLPRDLTVRFTGDYFARDTIPHFETGEQIPSPLLQHAGQEMHLHAGINRIQGYLRHHPILQMFLSTPEEIARPVAPIVPAVPGQRPSPAQVQAAIEASPTPSPTAMNTPRTGQTVPAGDPTAPVAPPPLPGPPQQQAAEDGDGDKSGGDDTSGSNRKRS